jgi:hypothetical protein
VSAHALDETQREGIRRRTVVRCERAAEEIARGDGLGDLHVEPAVEPALDVRRLVARDARDVREAEREREDDDDRQDVPR